MAGRLEELRRRAQERILQVRESMERGEESPYLPPAPEPPAHEPLRASSQPAPSQQTLEGPSLEGASLEGASLEGLRGLEAEPLRPAPPQEPQREERRTLRASGAAQPLQRTKLPPGAQSSERRSVAARLLGPESLRRAILAQEILGKPLALRGPRESEDI